MNPNFKNNLFFSIFLLIGCSLDSLAITTSSYASNITVYVENFNFLPIIADHFIQPVSNRQNYANLTSNHQMHLSNQFINSSVSGYSQNIDRSLFVLTRAGMQKLLSHRQEQRMLVLDKLCAAENSQSALSVPSVKSNLQYVKLLLLRIHETKLTKLFVRKKTLLDIEARSKFMNASVSGELDKLVENTKHTDLAIAQASFNELKELWPYQHKGSFLNPDSYSSRENKFIDQININTMKDAERNLLTHPDYIRKHTDLQSRATIEAYQKKCISLQRQGNRTALYKEVISLRERVKKNGRKEDVTTNVCLAIATKTFASPITSLLDNITHAPSLHEPGKRLDHLKRLIQKQAHQHKIFRPAEISELLRKEFGFNLNAAADQCYRSHASYISPLHDQHLPYDQLVRLTSDIASNELSEAYSNIIHFQQLIAEVFKQNNITDPIEQKNILIENFGHDIRATLQSTYQTRSDVMNIAKLFTSLDVQSTTARILNTSTNNQAVANEFQKVADVVLENARLCQVECVPQIEESIVQSLRVIREPKDHAETIFHVTVVDHLMTDLQCKSHAVATGKLPTWQRSTELLTTGVVAFVHGLDPISPIIDAGVLGIKATLFIANSTQSFIDHLIGTTINAAHAIGTTSINIVSTLINTAKFTCDIQLGQLYLPQEEYLQRCKEFSEMTEFLDHIETKHVIKISAYACGTILSPYALAGVWVHLNEIGAIAKLSDKAKVFTSGLKTAIAKHPSFATAEGIILKMNSAGGGPKNILKTTKELLEDVYVPISKNLAKEIEAIEKAIKLPAGFGKHANQKIEIAYSHILGIDIKWTDKINELSKFGGFHHDVNSAVENSKIINFSRKFVNEHECYSAILIMDGVRPAKKTFFPAHWSREKVINKIIEAHENFKQSGKMPTLLPDGKYKIQGFVKEGIEIEMYITQKGVIKSAYPIIKEF